MASKWVVFWRWLRKRGAKSAFVVAHCTFSHVDAWHFHYHVVLETASAMDWESTWALWNALVVKEAPWAEKCTRFARQLAAPGPAMDGVAEGQGDFFAPPQDEVERVLQYVVRDAGQGSERWGLELCPAERLKEFVVDASGIKWYRISGLWRERVGETALEVEERAERKAIAKGDGWRELGVVDEVLWKAISADGAERRAVRILYSRACAGGRLAERFREVVKMFSGS
jgi:hypothetical protein